jgi:hypothetical protein
MLQKRNHKTNQQDRQGGAEKDESCIKIMADGLIPVSRFAYKRLKSS